MRDADTTHDDTIQACVLSTGFGRRLGPAVSTKALIPFLGRPLVLRQLELFEKWGVVRSTVLVRSSQDPSALGLALAESAHPSEAVAADDWPGVFGWLRQMASKQAAEHFLTVDADLLFDASWRSVLDRHISQGSDLTLAVAASVGGDGQFGRPATLRTSDDGTVLREGGRETTFHFVGFSLTSAPALAEFGHLGLATEDPWADEFIPRLIARGYRVRLAPCHGYWRDLGTWRRIWAAHADRRPHFIDPSARVEAGAALAGWYWVGPGAVVEAGARAEDTVVGRGATISRGAQVMRSFVGDGASVTATDGLYERLVLKGQPPAEMPESLGT